MQFVITLKDAKRLITRCRPAVGKASGEDVHRNVALTASDSQVELVASSGELTARVTADGDVGVPGTVIVPFADLAAASKFKGARNSVRFGLDGGELTVTLIVDGEDSEQFTVATEASWLTAPTCRTEGVALDLAAVGYVLDAAGDDDTDDGPAGVLVRGSRVTATNSFLLADVDTGVDTELDVIVPAAAAKAAVRAKGPATIAVEGETVCIVAKEAEYLCQAVSDQFPAWEHLIPSEDAATMDVDVAALSDLVDAWAKLSNKQRLAPTLVLRGGSPINAYLPLDTIEHAELAGSAPGDLAVTPSQFKVFLSGLDLPTIFVPSPTEGETGGLLAAVATDSEGRTHTRLLQQQVCNVPALIAAA